LQIGGLGWESEFIDCTLYKNYSVLDAKGLGCDETRKIRAKAYCLPLQSDSVDMIIVRTYWSLIPSISNYERSRARFKAEGLLIVLNFNPGAYGLGISICGINKWQIHGRSLYF